MYAGPHGGTHATGFCLLGFSAGSGAVGYALAHYGLGDTVDYAELAAGPPFGRIDYGCDPTLYGAPAKTLSCPEIPTSPFAYTGAHLAFVQAIEGPTCGGTATLADIARWHDDSVVSSGATYAYPQTDLSFWLCGTMPHEANGLGDFYYDEVTSAKSLHCFAGTCTGEPAYTDPAALAQMADAMAAGCVPKHP